MQKSRNGGSFRGYPRVDEKVVETYLTLHNPSFLI